jgi:hypothetical protein
MKTRVFLEELAKFGWVVEREGNKHVILTNRLFSVERPLALRRQDVKDIDPIIVSVQSKHAGLIWDQGKQRAKLNPSHAYYKRYIGALGGAQAAA